MKKNFIVPHDFTEVANIALAHAVTTAKKVGASIHLLNVVKDESDISDALKKLEELSAIYSHDNIEIIPNIRVGRIFEDIGLFAAEHQSELIFMGTHGAHGWQHILGSNALKVVINSSVPFIIVQEKSIKPSGYDSIVVPMDLHKETKQKLTVVASLAKYFGSQVHVVTPDESDEFLRHQVESNIVFAERYFSDRNINMSSSIVPSHSFDREVIKYAASVGADLIAIMNLNKNSFISALTTNYEQNIITNDALIPTLIVNPTQISNEFSAMFTTY